MQRGCDKCKRMKESRRSWKKRKGVGVWVGTDGKAAKAFLEKISIVGSLIPSCKAEEISVDTVFK